MNKEGGDNTGQDHKSAPILAGETARLKAAQWVKEVASCMTGMNHRTKTCGGCISNRAGLKAQAKAS